MGKNLHAKGHRAVLDKVAEIVYDRTGYEEVVIRRGVGGGVLIDLFHYHHKKIYSKDQFQIRDGCIDYGQIKGFELSAEIVRSIEAAVECGIELNAH